MRDAEVVEFKARPPTLTEPELDVAIVGCFREDPGSDSRFLRALHDEVTRRKGE